MRIEDGRLRKGPERREHTRFEPPSRCTFTLRRRGFLALFGRCAVRKWLDVSEGGVRAMMEGEVRPGGEFTIDVRDNVFGDRFTIRAVARHVRPADGLTRGAMVGFEFVNPSPVLRCLIRGTTQPVPYAGRLPSLVADSALAATR